MSAENANAVKTNVSTEDNQTTLTIYAKFATERADTATDRQIVIATDEECQICMIISRASTTSHWKTDR